MGGPLDRTAARAAIAAITLLIACASAGFWAGRDTSLLPAAAALAILLAASAAFFLFLAAARRRLTRPLSCLTESIRRLGSGETDLAFPAIGRADEIGAIAAALGELRDAMDARFKAQERQAGRIIDALGSGLAALAAGELDADLDAELPGPYAPLGEHFNAALSNLRGLIGSVLESTDGLRAGAGEIAQAAEDLARRTGSNAASVEQSSAALGRVDMRLMAAADASAQTLRRADQALATVEDGRATADEAVAAMSRVNDSAEGIDTVIEGLDKIAFQTRVLAMNAAVEAGRAGETGRGFAVVADLVSALAMRAEEEARRARAQLTITQGEIGAAVEAVRRVDGALGRISDDVSEVHGQLGMMAADNRAQATAITEISAAVAAMDKATQQNAAMVQQTSAASRHLGERIEALAEQAGRFRIGTGASGPKHFVPQARQAEPPLGGRPREADWSQF